MSTNMQPFFADVQSHYDLSDDFFALFLDPTRTYSCAYFADPEATLEEAQKAKIDLSLGKCEISPGMKLLDIGCGWGHVQSLRLHYARTLDLWAGNLTAAKNWAIALTSQSVYDRYQKYLTGCTEQFRKGTIDVMQFCMRRN